MTRWTLGLEYVEYSDNAVRPTLYEKEILYSIDMLKRESAYFNTFLYGAANEKIEALNWLEETLSWSAKRWVQGLLFDSSATVRARAAEYIANSEFTHYLPDLKAALKNEKDDVTKSTLESSIYFLEDI